MKPEHIITLTMNPAIDISVSVKEMMTEHKIRCLKTRRDPGGGGINVARVLKRFGADPLAIFPMAGLPATCWNGWSRPRKCATNRS